MQRLLIGSSAWCWDVRDELPEHKLRQARLVYDRPASRIRHLWVHHTGVVYNDGNALGMQVAHLQRIAESGLYGLPYNFLVCSNGRRFYAGDVDTGRAHTGDFNDDLAVCLVGHFGRDLAGKLVQQPSQRMLLATRRLLRAIPGIWGHTPGHWPIFGHRESWTLFGSEHGRTQCPGDSVMEHIAWLRDEG